MNDPETLLWATPSATQAPTKKFPLAMIGGLAMIPLMALIWKMATSPTGSKNEIKKEVKKDKETEDAEEAKRQIMREMGRRGGQKSRKKPAVEKQNENEKEASIST